MAYLMKIAMKGEMEARKKIKDAAVVDVQATHKLKLPKDKFSELVELNSNLAPVKKASGAIQPSALMLDMVRKY